MKSTLFIALIASASSTLARLESPQFVLRNADLEIRDESGQSILNGDTALDYGATSKASGSIQSNPTIVDFDDIELAEPLAPITKYSNFTLGGFALMNVPLAYKNGSLLPEDIDCATSAPNALLGSRSNPSVWPRIALTSAFPGTSASSSGPGDSKPKTFKLTDLSIKPLGFVPQYLTISIQGWVIEDGRIVDRAGLYMMYLREGHQRAAKIGLKNWASWQKNITVVEMWAESREGEDWQFCVDDVIVDISEE